MPGPFWHHAVAGLGEPASDCVSSAAAMYPAARGSGRQGSNFDKRVRAQSDAKRRASASAGLGFGDAVSPAPREVAYPTLLDSPAPVLRAYPRETVVAEKLHAMVDLGLANSRMKDFFDLWFLATTFSFEEAVLAEAVRATFERRRTAIPETPPLALTTEFSEDPKKRAQWAAFVKKSRLAEPSLDLSSVVATLNRFLWPVVVAISPGQSLGASWTIGEAWR